MRMLTHTAAAATTTGTEHGPHIILAEQAVRGALHVRHFIGMRADTARQADHGLHK